MPSRRSGLISACSRAKPVTPERRLTPSSLASPSCAGTSSTMTIDGIALISEHFAYAGLTRGGLLARFPRSFSYQQPARIIGAHRLSEIVSLRVFTAGLIHLHRV